ncbi:syntaphilin [Eleginops maclovinus]|uniref:syntaphilin n=1 Tax=Eleginops maclovinus TaxID=56733 RepID=UPI00308023E1
MSAPAPANRRSGLGSRRFDYCRFIELDYVPMETDYMVSMRQTKSLASSKSPTKGYASTKSPDRHSRRTPATPSNRDPYGNTPLSSSSNSGSCKGSECSPTKGRHPKYTSCTDNHGIRPPPPEQYLTPLQQKEVCIRHLRARLKETINTLQDRDTEIDDLRGQLYRMQEDWVEEECHRVETQLALKDARQEIQQLKQAVDTVRDRLSDAGGLSGDIGVQKYFQDINTQNHKLENLLINMELAQAGLAKEGEPIPGCRTRVGGSAPASVSGESPGIPKPAVGGRGSCSCDCSPARSLTRSSTYTKLSEEALGDRNGNGPDYPCLSGDGTQDSGFVCCGESNITSRADLLLEAAFLSEETASLLNSYAQMPHSSTYEKLCTGERLASLRCGLGGAGCRSHPCLSHHHLYLHSLRETGIQTESCPIPATAGYPSDLDTIAEQRTFRSQACSPTSTWMSDEGDEELDSITTTTSITTATMMSTATEPILVTKTPPVHSLPRSATVACSMESPLCGGEEDVEEEEKQDKENREKEAATMAQQEETTVVRLAEEEQQTQGGSMGGNELEVQGTEDDLTETSAGMQGEFGGSCEEIRQVGSTLENLSLEDSQQEVGLAAGSPQIKKAELSPSCSGLSPDIEQPHTSQPRRSTSEEIASVTVVELHDEDNDEDETKEQGATGGATPEEDESSDSGTIVKSYWSRHFLVDLLAVAIPVVPTLAWFCRGPARGEQPIYHIGSLLRGCCTVALHSLRRGGGLRHYPAGGGDMGGSQI